MKEKTIIEFLQKILDIIYNVSIPVLLILYLVTGFTHLPFILLSIAMIGLKIDNKIDIKNKE